MAKAALLIGVSEYGSGLNPLPKAVEDIEAMKIVLQQPELGGFTEVKVLPNPDPFMMQVEIERLFSERTRDDLILLFFSGHGVKDYSGNLYFATSITRKTLDGELIKATAVPASFVHDIMSNSRSRRQVVILDCCFSGAFAKGLAAKDDGSLNIKEQLGGEGRVVLTSSASTEYSFEDAGTELSVYTRYLVEGIRSGAADDDSDGMVSVEELHAYAKRKVHEAAPAMKPKIYAMEEGFKILLTKSPKGDPKLTYRKEVERCASHGQISTIGRRILDELRDNLGLSAQCAIDIETEAFKPHHEYKVKLQSYEQALKESLQRESPLSECTWDELTRYQQVLGLRSQDVAPIKERIFSNPQSEKHSPSAKVECLSKVSPVLTQLPVTEGAIAYHPSQHKTVSSNFLLVVVSVISVVLLMGLGGFILSKHDLHPQPNPTVTGQISPPLPPKDKEKVEKLLLVERREKLGINNTFFNKLVDGSYYELYPDQRGYPLSNSEKDKDWRDRWRSIGKDWLNKLENNLSPEARTHLGSYTMQDAANRVREANKRNLSSQAVNDMTDAKFFSLFPNHNRESMKNASKFIQTNLGQIWHGIATDELQKVRAGEILQKLQFDSSGKSQVHGSLSSGEGMAYIFNLTKGSKLDVHVEVPDEAIKLSVYPPKLSKASPILADSTSTEISTKITQYGYYEVVIVSTSKQRFDYSLTLIAE
jgi:uncharacterized caspase-like protein